MSPFQIPPEQEACLRIIDEYRRGRLSLEDAAPRLQAALSANPHGLNIQVSPSLRRLFAEIARLNGRAPLEVAPDPDRHAGGGSDMLEDLEGKAWRAITHHPRGRELLSFSCHFAAATEAAARRLVAWLETHGNHHVTLESPAVADAVDWIVRADTPATRWTRVGVAQWAGSLRAAPLAGEASFMGWGV